MDIKSQKFSRTVDVTVTVQAQKILQETKYSVEDFLDWALKSNSISFGGHNVALFLEDMYNKNR